MCVCIEVERSPEFLGSMGMMPAHHGQLGGSKALPVPFGGSSHRLGGINEPVQLPLAQIVQHVEFFDQVSRGANWQFPDPCP